MTLILLKHSNYYNRILKRYNTVEEYISNSKELGTYHNINFKPNDSVATTQILNHQGDEPDYIICVNDDDNSINSRWYVVEDVRLLNGQYKYSLLRDVIADYYNDILTTPCFVEKALLAPTSPYIFNSEQMTFNQIKKEEYLLKDKSESTWIVGYVDRKYSDDTEIVVDAGDTIDYDNIIDLPQEYSGFVTNYSGGVASQ